MSSQLAVLVRREPAGATAVSEPDVVKDKAKDGRSKPGGGRASGEVRTAEHSKRKKESSTVQLDAIKSSVYISGGVALLLAVAYSLGNSTRQENQLPALRAISLGFLGFLASMLPVLMVLKLLSKVGAGKTSHSLLTFLQEHKSPSEVVWVAASSRRSPVA